MVSYDSESAETVLAPFTAMVIESPLVQPSALTIPVSAGTSCSSCRSFQERTSKNAEHRAVRGLTLEVDRDGLFMADLRIRVAPTYSVGFDRFDASAITAPNGVGTLFGILGEKNGAPRLKSTESLPELAGGARFDVPFETLGWDGPFNLRLTRADALPDGHALEILDRSTGLVHRLAAVGDGVELISAELGKLAVAPTASSTFRQVTPPPSLTAYQQRTIAQQKAGNLPRFELSVVPVTKTSIEDAVLPNGFHLSAAYPNPTRGVVYAQLQSDGGTVQFEVLDVLGRTRKTGSMLASAGVDRLSWDVSDLPRGPYWIRIQLASHTTVIPVTTL